ncbi:DUF2202 domain-containing protein [Sulfurimonas sp.]|uniref:ferritin-like domain-containing protein n=1 Tax=Sulfurimonas sp. TaxID=2022749 RepID=UPI0025D40F96|nr:DUF2202 domain-containing protein [Sulfurimonas sp.]
MNQDENQLLSQTVDLNANVVEQVLRIACYDEYKANTYYKKVIEAYGAIMPFSNIVQAEVRHYTAIENLCKKYGVLPPENDWYEKIQISSTLSGCCQDAVDAENANIQMYEKLLPYVMQDDIRDVFYREQAASYNNHLPAFMKCTQGLQTQTTPDQEHSEQHHDRYNMVQGLMSGDLDTAKLTQTLSSLASRDMMLGMAAGAALAATLSSDASKDLFSKLYNNQEQKDNS